MAAALVAKKAHMGNPVPEHDPSGDKLPEDSHCTLFAELKRQVCTSQHSFQTPLSFHRHLYPSTGDTGTQSLIVAELD